MKGFSEIKGKNVLVTGAGGFIGSHLCNNLLKYGSKIHGVSRKIQSGDEHIIWWQGDLTDIEFVKNTFKHARPDYIFHLASHVSGSRDMNMVIPTFQSNLATTVNLLIAATEFGCKRLVLAGSMEEPTNSEKAVPCSPYAAAKWAGNGYARMFHSLYKTPVVIARLFMVYGPGQQDLQKLIPYVILSFLNNQIPHLSSGTRHIDWIYVEDVVYGLLALAASKGVEGQTIDLGSGGLVSIREIVAILYSILKPKVEISFGTLPDRPMEQVKVADISGSFLKTGWKPALSLEEGLKLTVDWYRAHHTLPGGRSIGTSIAN
jgi:UDP-glucose 4-epimerase